MITPHFYAVIIGTEILNGRRTDKHFQFVTAALAQRGYELFASFIIKDDATLIASTYERIREDPHGVMFSFGGIGSTPDDLTREIAAKVFTGKATVRHPDFEQAILDRFGDTAYPNRIHMSDIPDNSALLHNPVNNMSGFYLEDRYFFMPGFPEMSHPMVEEALQQFFPQGIQRFRLSLLAYTSEDTLIHVMQQMPEAIELSSLPMFVDGKPQVEISVIGPHETQTHDAFASFTTALEAQGITYRTL